MEEIGKVNYTINKTLRSDSALLLLIRDDAVVFGRDLDGYRIFYKDYDDMKALALTIIKKIRELTKVVAVF